MYWDEFYGWRGFDAPAHFATKLITGPTAEPFTVAEAKLHLKIDIEDDDPNVDKWIRAARLTVEQDTQRAILTQTWDAFVDRLPVGRCALSMPFPPLQSVTSINQTDTAGVETVWASSNYIVDTASSPGRIALTDAGVWPTGLRFFQPVRIRFVAGWTPATLPADLRAAVGLWLGWLSEHRQPDTFEADAYGRLIQPYVLFAAA